MKTKYRRAILILILIIFLVNVAWGVSEFIIKRKYDKTSGIVNELNELKGMTNDNDIIKKINEIQGDVRFLNGVCFK